MGVIHVQNDFSRGVITREAFSRFDSDVYAKSAEVLENIYIKSLGQASRRFGLKYIAGVTASENQYKLQSFKYDADTAYLLVFTNNNIAVYYNDVKQADITTTYAGADVSDLKFAIGNNLLIITHPDYAPSKLVRGASHTSWTFGAISFSVQPAHDYTNDYNAITFTLSAAGVASGVTLTASANIFASTDVGGVFQGYGDLTTTQLGHARITGYTSPTQVTVTITSTFSSAFISGVLGIYCVLAEPAWTSARGYPISCAFHQGRLVFGGSKSLPNTIFMSKSENFFNFDVGSGLDDDAVQVTIEGNNFIKNVVSGTTLQVFTSSAEYSTLTTSNTPITPGSIAFSKQSSEGSTDIQPELFDNATIYIAKGGQRINDFRFDPAAEFYKSEPISIGAPNLINSPVDAATHTASTSEESRFYIIVNTDGTLAFLQSIQSEEVLAWTSGVTDGSFKRIEEVNGELYFLVKRNINGSDVTHIEKADYEYYLDSFITQTFGGGATTITGLSALNGETVHVMGDGFYLGTYTVSSNQITISRSSVDVTVGLNFESTITTLPFNIMSQTGPLAYNKKRVSRLWIDYYQSLGIKINDSFIIPYLEFGDMVLDQAPQVETGLYETTIVNGWDARQNITLKQTIPLPMTVLGIGAELTFGS